MTEILTWTPVILGFIIAMILIYLINKRKKKLIDKLANEAKESVREIRYEYEQVLRTVKRTMVRFFEREEAKQMSMGITDVTITVEKEEIKVYVQLERPGLLIGKGGRTVNALERELTEEFEETQNKRVSVKIIEEKMWQYKSMEALPPIEELTISEDKTSFKEFKKTSKGFY